MVPACKAQAEFRCLRYAVEFHNIARKAGFPIIRAFLLGQAIELYLKALLFHQGYGETQLKKRPLRPQPTPPGQRSRGKESGHEDS